MKRFFHVTKNVNFFTSNSVYYRSIVWVCCRSQYTLLPTFTKVISAECVLMLTIVMVCVHLNV